MNLKPDYVCLLYLLSTANKRSVYDQYGKEGLKEGATPGGRRECVCVREVNICVVLHYVCPHVH